MTTIDNLTSLRLQKQEIAPKNTAETQSNSAPKLPSEKKIARVHDEFVKEHRKNGVAERLYNWIKNKTNLGLGSNKVEKSIEQYANGEINKKEVKETIKKYRSSQANAQQALGDVTSLAAGMTAYSLVSNYIKNQTAIGKVGSNGLTTAGKALENAKYAKHVVKFLKNMTKTKRIAIATAASALVGGFAKKYIIKFDRVGSKEFKTDIPNDREHKYERKGEKKILNHERRKANWKNFLSGGLNGIIAPLASLAGGIVGVPLVLAANLGTRYVQTQKDKETKISAKDFAEKFKDNAILNTAAAALISVPLFKHAHYNKIFTKNLNKAVEKLKDVKLEEVFTSDKTAYTELKSMLLDSKTLKDIRFADIPVDEKITKVIDENIFAAKLIQNSGNSDSLCRALKENCPPTRTIEEAKNLVSKAYGNKYEISKLLGVGTVAESYLAKNAETGQEVCIKLLKEGMTSAKITADKQKMIDIVKSQVNDKKQLEYYINNIEDLAKAIGDELDLANEMKAAKQLATYTKQANVVKPIEIKDNIYVMEKAPGISLKTLQDVCNLEAQRNSLKHIQNCGKQDVTKELQAVEEKIKAAKAKAPDFGEINITPKEINRLLSQFMKAQTEQLDGLCKNGKILHGDIHPGNVFVDLKALKSGRGKAITLIDTGNIIEFNAEQSRNALKLSQYIQRGNVKDISAYVLEGAALPENMTKEAAREMMEKELKALFFDNKSALGYMNNDSLLALTSNIMTKHNIIPASTQLNFEKTKKSSYQSLQEIIKSFIEIKYSKVNETNPIKAMQMITKDVANFGYKYISAKKAQELKNMSQYTLKQILSNNPNMLKTNSEDYLTYHLKQHMSNNVFGDLI